MTRTTVPAGIEIHQITKRCGHEPNARKCQALAATPAEPVDILLRLDLGTVADGRGRIRQELVIIVGLIPDCRRVAHQSAFESAIAENVLD